MAIPDDQLFQLSPELRNIIYRQVLFDQDRSTDAGTTPVPHRLALFSTSRSVHREITSYFYAKTRFDLDMSSPPTTGATMLPPIADKYIRFLKNITIQLRMGCTSQPRVKRMASKLARLAESGAEFDEITLVICASPDISPFLNHRFDDSLLDMSHPITASLHRIFGAGVSKVVSVQLEGAWFAPGVAAQLHASFGSRIQFSMSGSKIRLNTPAEIPRCEREPMGYCSVSPLKMFTNDIASTSPPYADASFIASIGLESNLAGLDLESVSETGDPMFDEDMDLGGFSSEEELFSDDDLELDEELVPINGDDAKAIAANFQESAQLFTDGVANAVDIEFLTAMAPELL